MGYILGGGSLDNLDIWIAREYLFNELFCSKLGKLPSNPSISNIPGKRQHHRLRRSILHKIKSKVILLGYNDHGSRMGVLCERSFAVSSSDEILAIK
jgi:hypothetical protein